RLRHDQRHLRHRRRRLTRGHRGDRRPVGEALGRLRHRGEPDNGQRRARLRQDGRTVPVPVGIVGAGPGGPARRRALHGAGVDDGGVERGEVGKSWGEGGWDSLRLLTPNWMTALPGFGYEGGDPDGFMSAADTASFLDAYRASFDAPVLTGVTVETVSRAADGFRVHADGAQWTCDAVVAATGGSSEPRIPALAADVPGNVE